MHSHGLAGEQPAETNPLPGDGAAVVVVGEELHGRGSMLGRGGGSAGRTRRSRGTWAGSERVRRVRSSSRVSRSNYINTAGSIRIPTRQSASRVDAVDTWPPHAKVAAGEITRTNDDRGRLPRSR